MNFACSLSIVDCGRLILARREVDQRENGSRETRNQCAD